MADKTFLEFSQELPENESPALTDKVIGIQGEENLQTEIGDYKTLLSGDKIPKPETPSNGDTLVYNSTTEAWESAPTVLTTPDSNIISIDNNSNTDVLTDYQIKVNVTYNSNMKADFSDLRFWDIYDSTKLDYWIQSKIDGVSAIVWVKVPFIPASSSTKIIMKYGDAFAESESNGAATFPLGFDDFTSTNTHHQLPFGSDSGWMSGFDPVSRRFFFFGPVSDGGVDYNVTPWVNIDTWEVGYVQPPFLGSTAGVAYHPVKKKFYIYGGGKSGLRRTVYSFDPATDVFTLLSEQLLDELWDPCPCYDPVSGKIFIFGGRLTVQPNTFTDFIQVHDVDAGTITDTGANLWVPSDGMTPIYSEVDQRIYLFGGAYLSSGNTVDTARIYKYNPATPSVDPVYTGTDLAIPINTQGGAYVNGNIYLFGGYSYVGAAYSALIQKYSVVNNTVQTIDATMFQADDDMVGFYDPVKDRIFVGPVLYAPSSVNSDISKVMILELDPNTDFLYPQTVFGTAPTGWTNTSTATNGARLAGDSYCILTDYSNASAVSMRRAFTALSGIKRIDIRISVSGSTLVDNFNMQAYVAEPDIVGTNVFTKSIFQLNNNSTHWRVGSTNIAAAPSGYNEVSVIMNFNTEQVFGLLNNANKTGAIGFLNTAVGKTMNTVFISTGTGMVGAASVDWVRIRNSTTGIEPTATIE